jgi:hypothetical protein
MPRDYYPKSRIQNSDGQNRRDLPQTYRETFKMMSDMNNFIRYYLPKIIIIFCFIFISVAIIFAWQNPSEGYELDIYGSTPLITWVLIILAILGGIAIIIGQIKNKESKDKRLWLWALIVLILSRFSLLYIPYIRNYFSWSGDNLRYWGFIEDIVLTGHFESSNFYPITPTFLSEVISVTGIRLEIVANLSTAFISSLFVLSIGLLVGTVSHIKYPQIIALLVSGSVLLFDGYNVILSPNGWSIFFIPLLLYLYLNHESRNYRVLFVVLLLVFPFFHPLSSFMIVVVLIILEIMNWILAGVLVKNRLLPSPSPLIAYVVIEFTIFIIWITEHQVFHSNIQTVWQQITSGTGVDKLAEFGQSLNKLNVHGFDFYVLLLKMYGVDFILLILAIIGIFWLLKRMRRAHLGTDSQVLYSFAVAFIVCGLFYLAYLLGLPGTSSLGQGQWDRRFLGYVEVFLPLFAAFSLYLLLDVFKNRRSIYIGVFCLVSLSSILSVFTIYPSPITERPNDQVTRMENLGAQWLFVSKGKDVDYVYILISSIDFVMSERGKTETGKWIDIYHDISQVPNHLGYDKEGNLGSLFVTDRYLSVAAIDRIVYSTVWETVGRYKTEDFMKLDQDSTVSELYSNRGINYYYIRAK